MADLIWCCRGCTASFPAGEGQMIAEHVSACDYVDGAGNPLSGDQLENQRLTGFLSRLPVELHKEAAAALALAYAHGWRDATVSLEGTGADLLRDAIEERDESGEPPSLRSYLSGPLQGV